MTQKTAYNVTTEKENQENVLQDAEMEKKVEQVQQQVDNTGYPDISKADTKMIVIASLLVVIIIFLLSVFVPAKASAAEESSDVEIVAVTEEPSDVENAANVRCSFMDTLIEFNPESGFATKDQQVFYYGTDTTPYTGWLELDDNTYYFDEEGAMTTGWREIEAGQYYFDKAGILQKSRWIAKNDSRVYVDSTGCMLTNTIAPGGIYVGNDGYPDTSPASLATSQEGLTDLKNELTEMISGYTGTWSVYVKSLDRNEYLEINNVQQYSASLIKLYCGATIYDLIDKGELEETEYIDTLMQSMISVSDNDAFNLLVMQCDREYNSHVNGRSVIQNYIDENGYKDTTITSILVPSKYTAPSSPGRNYTTVVDCGLLLENIYKRQCVSQEASEKFLKLLLNQSHINKIPAGLPSGVVCANKTGDTDEVQHDAAIVYAPNGVYILCVMSTGCGSAINNIQSISAAVYEYFEK